MRKVALITAHDAPYKELADVTLPSLVAYAQNHGYQLYYQPDIPGEEKDVCKARIFRELLGEYGRDDLCLWLDTDALVMNPDIRVEEVWEKHADPDTHFLWSYNWDGPNSGVWIARFTDEAENYMRVYTYEQQAMGWGDNNAMNQKMLFPPFKYWVKCIPGKYMNASPYGEYGLQNQHHKNELNNYEPGDWILHLPGMEATRRMELLRQYAGQGVATIPEAATPTTIPNPIGPDGPPDWPIIRGIEEALKNPRGMHSCTDWALWHAVYRNNEYELNHDFNPEDVVVDIGMQSGSFTCLAYKRGSRNVLGYEMDKGAYDVAVQNVAYLKAGTDIQVFNKAVVGDTGGPVYYVPDSMQLNISGVGQKVESIHFDDILGPLKSVRYLKIDCEGSEWPILLTSKQLHKVQEIAGEYHCAPCPAAEGIPNRTPEALEAFLLSQGFTHTKFKDSGPDIGNFFAWR